MENKRRVAIAYIPVIHEGYLAYLDMLVKEGVRELYLVSDDILRSHEELDYINRKDRLRAVPHQTMLKLIGVVTTMEVKSLTLTAILELQSERVEIFAPREDINEVITDSYFGGHTINYQNVFLRWNKENIGEENEPKGESIELDAFHNEVMGKVLLESEKSADWWRQVGAALLKNGEVISIAHNEHMPEPELPNIYGDTRALFKKGVHINYATTAHAEINVIAEAARKGIASEGAELFTTDFPCPYCARAIAKSGIKKIYYRTGYAVLGGDDFLKQMGIETVKVLVD